MWIYEVLALLLIVGVASCFPESRVVNGTESHITRYPFMASLRNATGSHQCGCSIIAPRWIMTAAHCVTGETPNSLSIQYGVTDINASGPNIAFVEHIFIHKNYGVTADIALLELSEALVFNNKTLAPVTLPRQYYEVPQVAEGAPGVLIGWGLNAPGGSVQKRLQEVNLKIYSDEECNRRHNGRVTNHHICGGVDEGGKGQCSHDSGGPLLHILPQSIVQVGIVAWSKKPCTIKPYPGVYTKVSHYIDWINDTIASNSLQ